MDTKENNIAETFVCVIAWKENCIRKLPALPKQMDKLTASVKSFADRRGICLNDWDNCNLCVPLLKFVVIFS